MGGAGREKGISSSGHSLHRLHRSKFIAVDAGWMAELPNIL
jgi:hypothetical protein